jgi:hypothetical protein
MTLHCLVLKRAAGELATANHWPITFWSLNTEKIIAVKTLNDAVTSGKLIRNVSVAYYEYLKEIAPVSISRKTSYNDSIHFRFRRFFIQDNLF